MRIAVVSDVHGNWTALRAVLKDMKSVGADLVVHGGDLVGSGSRSADVVDLIRELGWPGIVGNTDEVLWRPEPLEAIAQANPALSTLWRILFADVASNRLEVGAERIRWLKSLPNIWSDHGVAIVHASPGDCWTSPFPEESDDEFGRVYGKLDAPLVIYGHVHQPFVRQLAGFVVANSGSVGLPYDGDPRASYLVIDDGRRTIRRVAYDVEAEIKEIASKGYPHVAWISAMLRQGRFVAPSD
jgi:predicted phosphodiesterase